MLIIAALHKLKFSEVAIMNRVGKTVLIFFGIALALTVLFLAAFFAARLMLVFDNDANASAIEKNYDEGLSQIEGDTDLRTNFLIMGKDEASGLYDVIMLVSYNATRSEIGVVQIPRDTYAEFTESSYKKLNGAVSALGGEREFCEFLSNALSVNIDHYISLDLYSVGEIVDVLGGVEVEVPFDMNYEDATQGLSIHLKKGKNILDGEAARKFVRYRSGYLEGDLGRMDAQKLFLAALVKKLKSDVSVFEIGAILAAVSDNIKMNVPMANVIPLAKQIMNIPAENVKFVTLAGEGAVAKASGASYYVISRPSAIKILNEILGAKVTEENFDKDRVFLNERYDSFCDIYNSEAEYKIFDAKTLVQSGIEIVHK